MENVINDLVGYKNMKIVQCNKFLNFSLDSVLLPNFITINKNVSKILDIGTGNAPIPLILSTKTNAKIFGIEIQKEIYTLALESVKINNLEGQITIINEDIKEYYKKIESDTFDIIVSNPPYFKVHEKSHFNDNDIKTKARHEILLKLEDIFKISKKLLKNNGVLGLVYRSDRLPELLEYAKKSNMEVKKIQFVYPKINLESNLVLVEARKNAKPGLKILKPLIIHESDGNYKEEILEMFRGEKE